MKSIITQLATNELYAFEEPFQFRLLGLAVLVYINRVLETGHLGINTAIGNLPLDLTYIYTAIF